MLPAL